jgi:hypothetical protein
MFDIARDVERADRSRFRAIWPDVRRTARKAGVT